MYIIITMAMRLKMVSQFKLDLNVIFATKFLRTKHLLAKISVNIYILEEIADDMR